MTVLPVVTRELSVQARRRSTYWIRVAASALAGFLTLWLLFGTAASAPLASQGRYLFSILSLLAFGYCLGMGALVTADSLSVEKREGTLGLLFLTDLKGYDVVLGKLISSSLHAVFGLLAALPMMSLALLFGGIGAGELIQTSLVLANTLFLSLAVGMFVSTLSRDDRKAAFAGLFLILLITAGPYEVAFLNYLTGSSASLDESILSPSPAFAFSLARSPSAVGVAPGAGLIRSLTATHLLAWVLLGLSCIVAPRVWKDRPQGKSGERWTERWRRACLGNPGQRASFRRRLLDRNPCFWLSSRERQSRATVWILIVPLAALGYWTYDRYWMAFYEVSILLVFVMHVMLKTWFAGETSRRWIEDRRNGALELLLCSPVTVGEMVRGQGLALRRQFGWPIVAALGLTALALSGLEKFTNRGFTGLEGWQWLKVSLAALPADVAALRWVAAWRGLTARSHNRAIAGTLFRVLGLRWIVYFFLIGANYLWTWTGFGAAPRALSPVWWLALALAFDLGLAWTSRRRFLRHVRTIAANPSGWKSALEKVNSPLPSAEGLTPETVLAETAAVRRMQWWSRLTRQTKIAWVAATVVVVGFGGYRYWLSWRVASRLQAVERAGLPLRREKQFDTRPPSTNTVNAAEVVESASAKLVTLQMLPPPILQNLPGMLPGHSPALLSSRLLSPPAESAIAVVLATNREALAILHRAPSLKSGRYAVTGTDQEFGGARFQTHVQAFWTIAPLLQAEVTVGGEQGDAAGALDSLRRLFELGQSLDFESAPMFHFLQSVCYERGFVALQAYLATWHPSEPDLKALQDDLAEIGAGTDWKQMLIKMRAASVETFRRKPAFFSFSGPGGPKTMEIILFQVRNQLRDWSGTNDREFSEYLDVVEQFIRLSPMPWPDRFRLAQDLTASNPGPVFFYQGLSTPQPSLFSAKYVFDTWITPNAVLEARRRVCAAALAVERYRRQRDDALPKSLNDLAPEFIQEAPTDPFDGQPLRFKRFASGYRIYSVGPNGLDEDGAELDPLRVGRPTPISGDISVTVDR